MPRAGVEVIGAIEDDVLGCFDAPEPDQRHIAQLVVQRVAPCTLLAAIRCRSELVVSRADVNLADDALPVFQPAHVDHRCQHQDGGQHHADHAARSRHRRQPVGDQQHQQRTDQRLRDRTAPATQADAAQHGGRQYQHLHADADVGTGGRQPRRKKAARGTGQDAAADVAQRHRAPHRDTAVVGRAARPADGQDVPAEAQPGQQHMPTDGGHGIHPGHRWHAQEGAVSQEVPDLRIGQVSCDVGGVLHAQQFVGRAENDQRDQRREKCTQT